MAERSRKKSKISEKQQLEQDDLLKYYLKDVRKYPLLRQKRKKSLLK
jgi:hypothetical protein